MFDRHGFYQPPFVANLQRTSAVSFTEPSPHPSPSPSVDLCSICALVQIFYCFLCTSQNSLSLAEHNYCAPVKVSFHWLLRFSALVVNYSLWIVNKYSPKWRWLVVDIYRPAKQGKYPMLVYTKTVDSVKRVR